MTRMTADALAFDQAKAERNLTAGRKAGHVSQTEVQGPTLTYVAGVSPIADPVAFATFVAGALKGYGATVTPTIGVWDGDIEPGVTVEYQGPARVFVSLLEAIAGAYPELRMVHTEARETEVTYVDLDDWRV